MSDQIVVKDFFRKESVIQSFREVLGEREANGYIASVLIAVANSTSLQECSPVSVVSSAMRAATLRLSCDPSTGQAYLVPFKGKCTLVIGYKGLLHMAQRTGRYRYINISRVYEGEEIIEDRLTGMHSFSGGKKSPTIIGYLLYFELVSGFQKTFYMTVEEITAHAQRYSKSYDYKDSAWKTNVDDMQRKTVLRLGLSRWGYFDPHDTMIMNRIDDAAEPDQDIVDAVGTEAEPEPERERLSEAEILNDLGF